MDLESLMRALEGHNSLQQLPVEKLLAFILRASMLKRDIMQPQALLVPTDMAPDQLPPSVSQFLSHSLNIPLDYTREYWSILKDIIWDYPTAEDVKRADKEAFRIHGKKCGLSEYLHTF
jgi:hypothetical protein